MKDADTQVKAIFIEVGKIFKDPKKFFGAAWASASGDYVKKWHEFESLAKTGRAVDQFKAGVIAGEVLTTVVLTVLAIISGVGAAVSTGEAVVGGVRTLLGAAEVTEAAANTLAKEAPELVKAARGLEDAKSLEGGASGDAAPEPPLSNKKTLDQIPHARRNGRLAGKQHPKTGVPFNEKGYPIFDSAYSTDLPPELQGPDVSDTTQFKYATKQLKQEIANNPEMADQFTPQQLDEINSESPKIEDYTWHHNENGVTLDLVDQDIHAQTGHDGGRVLTGGRP